MSLTGNIQDLTAEHVTMIDGRPEKVPALLDQLDAALTDKNGRTSAGGGSKALPISDAAYSLWQDINVAARRLAKKIISMLTIDAVDRKRLRTE